MNAPTVEPALLPFHAEWHAVRTWHHNVLIEGSEAASDRVLALLKPHLPEPSVWRRPPAPLELPTGKIASLVLENVGALNDHDQNRLLAWLEGEGSSAQLVALSTDALYARVVAGTFVPDLYYRLNVVLLRVNDTSPADLGECDAVDESQPE